MCATFNPIALRTAKTLLSFGHSECNRVKKEKQYKQKICHAMRNNALMHVEAL